MDLAKIEKVETFDCKFRAGRRDQDERINRMLKEGWVLITTKIIQCGNSRDGFYSELCVVMGKPKPRTVRQEKKLTPEEKAAKEAEEIHHVTGKSMF